MKKFIKILSLMALAICFLGMKGIGAEAKTIQTEEGDTTITIKWDEKSSAKYQIGYAEIPYDTSPSKALASAKSMADKGKIKVATNKKTYKITGLKKNSNYAVAVKYKSGNKWYYSTNTYTYTKMPAKLSLSFDPRMKKQQKNGNYWFLSTICYNATYEYRIVQETKVNKITSTVKVDGGFCYGITAGKGRTYKVQVRAVRKINSKYSSVGKTCTGWSNVLSFKY